MSTAVIIPARLASSRLPGKVLEDIGGKPLILNVWERAQQAHVGEVYVACAEEEVASVVRGVGGRAVMTDPRLPSGTDRVWAAVHEVEKEMGPLEHIINLQGDLPLVEPVLLQEVLPLLEKEPRADMATLAASIPPGDIRREQPQVVKIALSMTPGESYGRALYFSRSLIPYGPGLCAHHMGIYAFKRAALERFVSLPPSPLEQREGLEQLRALEAGMNIFVQMVETVPLEVNTPEDLQQVRAALRARGP
ncbi:MAG: 3-deoxy-manno-octulosonate cytidylyltransferase [Holosporales bacterium]|jgi:3-deoxy-manno-octulosonate cytidylyltransferase (CMP-KDO synthetase)|nr:3-deoxy-manno-octulosonate cytidylyltransferase [Holosporales bacterium]